MAAKRKYPAPKLRIDLPWLQLTKAQQNSLYVKALHAYTIGEGPNPSTSGEFARKRLAAESAAETRR